MCVCVCVLFLEPVRMREQVCLDKHYEYDFVLEIASKKFAFEKYAFEKFAFEKYAVEKDVLDEHCEYEIWFCTHLLLCMSAFLLFYKSVCLLLCKSAFLLLCKIVCLLLCKSACLCLYMFAFVCITTYLLFGCACKYIHAYIYMRPNVHACIE